MENFKEIAEKCLRGELSGTFVLRNGGSWKSNTLSRYSIEGKIMPGYYVLGKGLILDSNGLNAAIEERVQNFIPDVKKEQIKIDIPEGKVPIMEQTENGVVITWKNQELTYNRLYQSIYKDDKAISSVNNTLRNDTSNRFLTKINVLRKLINIRNYFGKPYSYQLGFCINCYPDDKTFYVGNVNCPVDWGADVVFAKREQAEQAINMLGDELKYLFEPW